MLVAYDCPTFDVASAQRTITARFRLVNRSHDTWRVADGLAIGWQIYDPETSTFIREGQWTSLTDDLASAQMADLQVTIDLPPERGHYHIYLSPVDPRNGWFYTQGEPFLLIDAFVEHGAAHLLDARVTTVRSLRR